MAPDISIERMVKVFSVAYNNTTQRMMINAICVCVRFFRAIVQSIGDAQR